MSANVCGSRFPSFAHGPAPQHLKEHEASTTSMVAKQFSTNRAPPSFQVTTTTRNNPPSARNANNNVPTPARGSLRAPPTCTQSAEPQPQMRWTQSEMGTRNVESGAAAGDRLDLALSPGDVLCVQGRDGGNMMRLGASGGYMGHVLLVTGPLRGVQRNTPQAMHYQHVWPSQQYDARILWIVRTMESTRSSEGYHESDYLLFVDEKSGRIFAVAEEQNHTFLKFEQPEPIFVWQCPPALRRGFRFDIMGHVLAEMKQSEGNWSWATAVRAFLFSAKVSDNHSSMLQDIQQCWMAEPICSSLVVVFWQRYLCALADMHNATPNPNATEVNALDLILQFMPLKSDRALPGELLSTMQQCDWVSITRLPQAGRPRLNTY